MTKHKSCGSCTRKKLIICFVVFSLLRSSSPTQAYSLREAVQNYSWREAVVDVVLEVVVGGVTKRIIGRRLLARVASSAGKFVVKEMIFRDRTGVLVMLRSVRVGKVYTQEAGHCVERVEYRVVRISEVRSAGGKAKITVVGVSGVPGSWFNGRVFIDRPRGIVASDPYVQVWEGAALIGNTTVRQNTTSARFGESFEVDFLKAERVWVVLKDQDTGRDDTLGEILFSERLPVGDERRFHMACGATLTLAIQVVGETRHGRTAREATMSTTEKLKPIKIPTSSVREEKNEYESLRQQKLDYFNNEKQRVISLIKAGRLEEADKLALKLKQEIQEARRKGFIE